MLSADRQRAFENDGIAALRGVIAPEPVAAMRAGVWAHLRSAHGMRESDPSSWRPARPTGLQALTRSDAFAAMRSPALVSALDQLLGEQAWLEPEHWGPPLVSFPDARAWDVPAKMWHLDDAIAPRRPLTAVRAFAFLTPVRPSGGATLAISGSHRVLAALAREASGALRSAEARRALAACDPWFAALERGGVANRGQHFMRDGALVRGVPVRAVELCGEAGDVVLMRADLLHAAAPHVLPEPRFVVAQFVYRAPHPRRPGDG